MSGLTKDDIIRMAREAGWGFSNSRDSDFVNAQLKFAELVAAAEREACAEACNDAVGSASMYDSPDSAKFAYGIKNYCQELIRARGKDAA
jgi:hypothetical protein